MWHQPGCSRHGSCPGMIPATHPHCQFFQRTRLKIILSKIFETAVLCDVEIISDMEIANLVPYQQVNVCYENENSSLNKITQKLSF